MYSSHCRPTRLPISQLSGLYKTPRRVLEAEYGAVGVIEVIEILHDPSVEGTAIVAVADGSRCRIEVCPRPVHVACVVFHWPARVFWVLNEAEQDFHYTQTLAYCTNDIPKRGPPTEGSR
jgi:hypothetical protein